MYYDYRIIDGYNAPITVILSKRGLGKTFGRVIRCVKRFINKGKKFVYVVESEVMKDTLTQDKGAKFFNSILEFLENNKSASNNKCYEYMMGNVTEVEETEKAEDRIHNKILGGTIKIGGATAGYIISLNSFALLKRNNFRDINEIIIDEFIPENIDIRSMRNTYKLVNLIQSIARLKNIRIYMLGNAIRLNDDILIKMKLTNLRPGEIRLIKDKYGLLVACHYVDNKEYEEFTKVADASVAGRLATLTGQDNLERNEFNDAITDDQLIPHNAKPSHLLICLHGESGSVRINVTKDYTTYYVYEDYGTNTNNRYCIDIKYVSPVVKYYPDWKDVLIQKFVSKQILFENSYVATIFKNILKLSLN